MNNAPDKISSQGTQGKELLLVHQCTMQHFEITLYSGAGEVCLIAVPTLNIAQL